MTTQVLMKRLSEPKGIAMILFAFDRDQTVETNQGPVRISTIRRLVGEGHLCYAVGNDASRSNTKGKIA